MMLRATVLVLAVATFAPRASAGPLQKPVTEHAVVDWSRAEIRARGAAPADLRAPTPAVARTKALRLATRQARKRLVAAVARLPAAEGGKVGEIEAETLELALRSAAVVDRTLGSDGSVMVTLALGIEAVRAARAAPLKAGLGPVDTVWVDARKIDLVPAVGIRLRAGDFEYRGPSVFYLSEKAAGKDARLATGKRALRTRASSAAGGRVELDGTGEAALAAASAGSPTIVFLVRRVRKSR